MALPEVLIDGRLWAANEASISVFDLSLQRGFGAFESMHAYHGVPFRLGAHLDRLEVSSGALGLVLPPRSKIEAWVLDRAEAGRGLGPNDEAAVRLFVTAGTERPGLDGPRTIVTVDPPPEQPEEFAALPTPAPWHAAGTASELTGAKTLSYAPNVAATRAAKAAGFHDAVLVSRDGIVLEGPTYSVAWFRDGRLETPALDLGILQSITRAAVIEVAAELGIRVDEGAFPLARMESADEACVFSTFKEVLPVRRLGNVEFGAGPLTMKLRSGFLELVARETAR